MARGHAKQRVAAIMAEEQEEKEGLSELPHAFVTGRVWLLGAAYFCIASGIYIVSFWIPTIIKQNGRDRSFQDWSPDSHSLPCRCGVDDYSLRTRRPR